MTDLVSPGSCKGGHLTDWQRHHVMATTSRYSGEIVQASQPSGQNKSASLSQWLSRMIGKTQPHNRAAVRCLARAASGK